MESKKIITIAGNNGGGKSTTAKKVAEILGYSHMSTGDKMREMATERGISLEELGELAKKNPQIDRELDDFNKEIAQKQNVVLDSRLGFHFIPESFKVFLECDPHTAATRIFEDMKKNKNRLSESKSGFGTIEEIEQSIIKRLESEKTRYKDWYGVQDHTAPGNYNLVINTALRENSIEHVVDTIVNAYKKFLNKEMYL